MRFKLDENLPVEVARLLRQHQHDVSTVLGQQLGGHSDSDLARACVFEQRALVTLDLDFSDIRVYPPEAFAGIVVLRPAIATIPMVLRLVEGVIALLNHEPLVGHLWVVDEMRVRIRSSDASTETPPQSGRR